MRNHPDKGGDPKVFNELREAYEVLGDAEKRRPLGREEQESMEKSTEKRRFFIVFLRFSRVSQHIWPFLRQYNLGAAPFLSLGCCRRWDAAGEEHGDRLEGGGGAEGAAGGATEPGAEEPPAVQHARRPRWGLGLCRPLRGLL